MEEIKSEKTITFEDIQKANEAIKTIAIARKDKKTGKTIKKNYAEVSQRIKAYRTVYPTGLIDTQMIISEDKLSCIFIATIYDEKGKKLATATAQENSKSSIINQTNFIENCETSAVGRALGMCGFGIDVSLASAEEVQNAVDKQEQIEDTLDDSPMTEEQSYIIASLDPKLKEQLRAFYEKDIMKLTRKEANDSIQSLKNRGLYKSVEEIKMEAKEKEEVF